MAGKANYRLEVPLDASGVKDFKPDRAVKVVAFDAKDRAYEGVVKFDAKGKGSAALSFDERPGSVRVVVGPESATTEQMRGLQTISFNVSSRQWANKKELSLNPVAISAFYWWWWWYWCRTFRITGRVLCANGNPVPGAQVCAYDVDWWWWWWSNQQVGCATTDVNGAFEIDFTWCCGWWPWWWWRYRTWLLEPTLAERISRLLREDLRLTKIPPPGPNPDPVIFQTLFGETVRTSLRSSASVPRLQSAGHREALAAQAPQAARAVFDPGSLESLRTRLVAKLPPVEEFARLRLWPWWPWWPWWDCTPDIIFKVTQDCRGQNQVILDENIWNARQDIPTNLNVTLVANDLACCATGSTCIDEGTCGFISDICEDNLDFIGGNPGMNSGASQVGYLNPGLASSNGDRPYSGTIPIRGCVGTDVDYYEFLISTDSGPMKTWNALPVPAAGGVPRSYWDNGVKKWIPVNFPFTQISDGVINHNVIESVPHWEANNGAQLWDFFTLDILMELITNNVLADGTYYLSMQGYTRPGYAGNLANPQQLLVCGSNDLLMIAITIDNHLVTAGPNDLNGHPCAGTVHACTIEPDTEVHTVKILHNNGTSTNVGACGNVPITDTDLLQIDFAAHDPDPNPHLAYYTLELHYDINLVTNLLNPGLPSWSLVSSGAIPWAPPAGLQVGPDYGDALAQGAASPHWAGGGLRLTVNAKSVFPYTCCYELRLVAHKRTIGGGGTGCDHSFWNQYNQTEYSFTITV
jgi:hypothetical protein